MGAHFPAAHFVNVIAPSVNDLPSHGSIPGRRGRGRGPHRVLPSVHPRCAFVPRVKAQRAGLSCKTPPPLPPPTLVRGTSPQKTFPSPTWRGRNSQGRIRLQTLTPQARPPSVWSRDLCAAPSSSREQRAWKRCAMEAHRGGISPEIRPRRDDISYRGLRATSLF